MLLVLFLACDKYKIVKVDEIEDSAGAEIDDGACPDIVPEEYRYIWDCANDSCGGAMVYRNACFGCPDKQSKSVSNFREQRNSHSDV